LISGLHKGVPPLFVDLRSLYTDQNKVDIIQSLILQYKDALKAHCHFSDEDKDKPQEPASALLWNYYYISQHYDFLGYTQKALDEIDAAIYHTPTLIELFVTKGRIYKVKYPKKFYVFVNNNEAINKQISVRKLNILILNEFYYFYKIQYL
jgi:hypothetical protein